MSATSASRPAPELVLAKRVRRLSWGLIDQGAGSLTTLCLSVGALRASTDGAAEFALVFLIHSLAVGFCRSITTEPVAQELPAYAADRVRAHVAASAVTGLAVGLLSALLSAAVVRPDTMLGLWSLAFALLIVPTDAVRAAWIGARYTVRAAPYSLIQLLAAVAGLVVVLAGGSAGWALAPVVLVSGVLTLVVLAGGPRPDADGLRPRHWFYAGEWSLTSGLAQSSGLVVAALGLPLMPLLVRAQGVAFGPLSSLTQAVAALSVPEFVTAGRWRLMRPAVQLSAGLTGISAVYALVVLALPHGVVEAVLGSAAEAFAPVLVAAAAAIVASGVAMGPLVALRAHGAARDSLGARLVLGVSRLVLAVGGALIWGVPGFFWATAVAGVVGGAWAMLALRRVERSTQPRPVAVDA